MKILYCNKYNFRFSGTEAYLFEVMDLVRAHGHEAALFSMTDARGEPTRFDRHFVPPIDFKSGAGGPFARVKRAARAIYSIEARRRLRGMIAEFQPDVAHVRNIYHHLTPSILWELKAQGVPVVYHLNDFKLICPSYNLVAHGHACERCVGGKFHHVLSEGCYAGPRGAAWVLAAEAYAHKWLGTYRQCVDCFLAPSEFVKSKLAQNGWEADKIKVLPHFQTLCGDAPPPAKENAPILYFGRLSPEKGVRDLLLAMQGLPGVRLQIAGEGPQRHELEALAGQLHLANVEFLGRLQNAALQRVIASARFTVLPSRAYETLGKTILESYAQQRAVVASDLGSRRELVQEGVSGLLFPPGDVAGLARAISYLVEHPERAEAMGAAGREIVRLRHSPEAHYRALSQLYEGLCRAKNPGSPEVVRPEPAKLRVAFIGGRGVGSKYSGIETYYEEAGSRLAELGYEVTIYCRSYFTPPLWQYRGMRVVRLPTIRTQHLETPVHTLLSSLHALFCGYDVVHYHALGPALFSCIPRIAGTKTAVTVQGLDWQRKKWGWLAAAVLRQGERAAVRLPDATMVVSRTLQQHYRTRYGAETIYVPNGANLIEQPGRDFGPGTVREAYILFLGRFSREKNCHLLIAAYERLRTATKLILAGGSIYPDAYSQELRRHANSRIELRDWVSGKDRDELLGNAILLVLPSDVEGLSLVLLEAMAAGVCVLASDIPENREVLGGAGFTFEPGNVDDLSRVLARLLADAPARRAAAERGRIRVRDRYLWSQVAGQIDRTYRALAGRTEVPVLPATALPLKSKPVSQRPAA